ncbi:TDT family transporter [Mammaliicoccus sciuri]|uniref:TDT family transporter n=1 Tax=Mammaliicoccus sciuri TaxID=1296 RepID=UPI001FB368F8|nr:TDT family transporter [Mammaliicoccus sciuri]MCJ0925124.1 TDT family transporter [Mammaliicoccus sciuri]
MFITALKRTPIAMSGLALGVMALSNLFYHLSLMTLGLCSLIISCAIILMFCTKWIVYPHMFLQELKNIHTFAISPTFPMTLMLLASILKTAYEIQVYALNVLWYIAIVLHACLIMIFIVKYAFRNFKSWPNTSWFVMFVGTGVISETSTAFNETLGHVSTIFGTICLVLILAYVLISKSWQTYNQEQLPMVIIMSAPAALCLNGYILNNTNYSNVYIIILLVLSQVLFIFTLIFLPKILQRGFKVSFSAMTFPWVTTAASIYNVTQHSHASSSIITFGTILSVIEITWAAIIVCYVLYQYVVFLTTKDVEYS